MSRYEASATASQSSLTSQPTNGSVRGPEWSYLHPQDAFYAHSPPRSRGSRQQSPLERSGTVTAASSADSRKRRDHRRGRSSSRRRRGGDAGAAKGQWKKLLWVKQSYPDNYTDEETFLDHLQRNPRLRPYEFWPLVADSTIIVQHVCSVIIFVCCFIGIFLDRISPQTVVSLATVGTVAGWVLRDFWQSREEAEASERQRSQQEGQGGEEAVQEPSSSGSGSPQFGMPFREGPNLITTNDGLSSRSHSRNPSNTSAGGTSSIPSPIIANSEPNPSASFTSISSTHIPPWKGKPSAFSPRMQERLMTAKSAILIYCSLLGLSPILKSLTKSTSSDSIWALSSWLMILNVFTFDYGAGPEAKFPASLSTNAALMASTVLASRLPSTTHVFSLTLFSIEVFGLFPVFRRHLRHHSWTGHLWLTTFLVILASGGLSMVISGGGWVVGAVGVVLGGLITCLSMGLTSWWLIGLQRYKNEIRGPWDPARPVIGRGWD